MKTRLSAARAAATVAALIASSVLAAAGPAEAAANGTVTVSVVDQFGQPADVSLIAFDQFGSPYPGVSPFAVSGSQTFSLQPGSYSFLSQGPWSGFDCYGISPCTPGSGGFGAGTVYTPVVTVAEGGIASYTARVTMPTVTGGPTVGSTLAIQTSPGYQQMQSLAAANTSKSAAHTQQWLRGSADIPAATGTTYATAPADAAQQVSARLSPSPAIAALFASNGYVVPPFTTRPVGIVKIPTKTNALYLAGGILKVKVKGLPGSLPDGKIKLSLGAFKAKATLKKGKATIPLPANLEPGRYTLKVKYLGSQAFEPSKSKKKTLTVR